MNQFEKEQLKHDTESPYDNESDGECKICKDWLEYCECVKEDV